MISGSIPVAAFSERISEPSQLVQSWPFADLAPAQEHRTTIGSGLRASDGMAVGWIRFVHEESGTAGFLVPGYRGFRGEDISLVLENPDIARRWKLMAGVALALEVSVVGQPNTQHSRFKPESILAVEPPLTHPARQSAYNIRPQPARESESGYIQGVIRGAHDTDRQGKYASMQLEVEGSERLVFLNCHVSPRLRATDMKVLDAVHSGDVVRATTEHTIEDQAAYMAGGILYCLSK